MQHKQLTITYKNSIIAYAVFGNGTRQLLCLHGYGLTGTSFNFLNDFLGNDFTLICIDFPYHGNTIWNNGLFTLQDIEAILSLLEITSTFSILGYSMGGRVGLQLLESIPLKIEQMVLIAPDGLHNNPWQKLATQSKLGNRFFKFTMQQPQWFFYLLSIGFSIGLLNKSIKKFVHFYIDDANERMALYKRWTAMKLFKPNLKKIQNNITKHNIPVSILFGKYDRIIISKRGNQFKQNQSLITIKEISAGHQLLQKKYAQEIAAAFTV